jgi:hypothetical protein
MVLIEGLVMAKYVKVPIFPLTKYMTADERKKMPAPMKPVSFMFGDDEVLVDRVLCCERGVSRKVGGRGYRFDCRVSWCIDQRWRTKQSVVWYDDFLQEWFVEVRESRALADWYSATQLSDIGEFYDD